MCGIVGIFDWRGGGKTADLLQRMTKTISHRGPDDEGYLLANANTLRYEQRSGQATVPELQEKLKLISLPSEFEWNIALGHRRLAILDLSEAGHQPMSNEDGTVWIVHNGEIYNYLELREELSSYGHHFISRTDTEVILHGYEQWGKACLNRFNGMWAFAIWDSRLRKLFCSRDRFGVKPFYYYFDGAGFAFASEIKALLEAEFIVRKPNDQTVFDFLASSLQDCTEGTFFEGIRQLKGGYFLEYMPLDKELLVKRYYDIPMDRKMIGLSDESYSLKFRQLFENSIKLRLISDAPVGSCLSGGLDSSSIVCMIDLLMREMGLKIPGTGDVQKTFSARFNEKKYDEGAFIDDVIKKTGVESYTVYPDAASTWKSLAQIIWHQDEPCVHTYVSSQWQVYKLAKEMGVKVVLDGQGGDELLAGYDRYYSALFSDLMRTFQWLDLGRELLSRYRSGGSVTIRDFFQGAFHLLPRNLQMRVRAYLRPDGNTCLNSDFASGRTAYYYRKQANGNVMVDSFDELLYELFINSQLPGLLRDLDKNSMAHSIESRSPFLDYRLVECIFSMPWKQKIRQGCRKYVLRNAMSQILPDSVAKREDKMPFATPVDIWMTTQLADNMTDLFGSPRFRQRGFLNASEVEKEFQAHRKGQKNIGRLLWRWLTLEIWMREFIDK
ncbi:MAG: asparagine synthase (glutamine-hydrolyzing) [Chloroflexi bacterium RBG_16_48_7]|nr:MAG: asparagine synthase (glutamine-hydrolyzing) [Chloroflexi bacterium RBG_16_48_7]